MLVPMKNAVQMKKSYSFFWNIKIIKVIHFYKGGEAVREIEVIIDTDEIAEFFFQELLKRGYVPSERELDDLADITFEYLLEKCIIDEEMSDDFFIDDNG